MGGGERRRSAREALPRESASIYSRGEMDKPKRARLTCRSSSRWQLCGHLPSYSARHMTPPELPPLRATPVVLLALPNQSACAGDDGALLEGPSSVGRAASPWNGE